MKRVILTKGLPGSGKTHYAKERLREAPGKYKRINKDDLRAMLDDGKWSKHNEQYIIAARDALILAALQAGYSIIVDDTNLSAKHEAHIRELVKSQAVVEIEDFTDVPLDVCIERDRKRANYVGEQVIRRMYRDFLAPKRPIIEHNSLLHNAILSDLDGTLALLNGRNPYDASECEKDIVNKPVADIIARYSQAGITIILLSGRSEIHRPQTLQWLAKNGIEYDALFMRDEGDNRKDAIIKRELYEGYIQRDYNVLFVLDDRQQVVDLWRSIGLTCLQVDYGDF